VQRGVGSYGQCIHDESLYGGGSGRHFELIMDRVGRGGAFLKSKTRIWQEEKSQEEEAFKLRGSKYKDGESLS